MTGKDILKQELSVKEYKQVLKNINQSLTIEWVLENEYNCIGEILGGLFVWNMTDEGYKYWYNISNRTQGGFKHKRYIKEINGF